MSSLLEFREKLKLIYSRNDIYIISVMKFLLAFLALTVINGNMGYMNKLDNLAIVLIVSLLCSFLPSGCILFFAALFSLLHMYELSIEVAVVGLCLYLVVFLLFLRFSPRGSLLVLVTPLLFVFHVPYIVPLAAGLLATPAAAVSSGCGVVVYFFLSNVIANAQAISAMEAEEAVAKLQLVINALLGNKEMLVLVISFSFTIIVVYLIRRMSVAYAWTIAILTGGIANLIVLLVADLKYDTNMSLGGAVAGTAIAVLVAKVIEFFRFCVDYNRTEKVQFEDDEYYYYVKAVPKMTVAAQTKRVKRINTQRKSLSGRGQRTRSVRPQEDLSGPKRGRQGSFVRSGTVDEDMVMDVLDEVVVSDAEDFVNEDYVEDEGYVQGVEDDGALGYGEDAEGYPYEEEGYDSEDVPRNDPNVYEDL